ncbi:MAG: 50S ribosomal protein L4 [Anaerolineae bacterium]|nr:50S ribosomal protein L4 [Anaerolineae bacterium]
MKVAVKNLQGQQVGEVELPDNIFNVEVNEALMHQSLLRQNANAHLGTHKVKTRAEVSRTKKKMFGQKGTGNARQGNRKAPHWVGGGVAFGPVVHSYTQAMPKKMVRGAIRSALSQKCHDQEIIVVDSLELSQPKTKDFMTAMKALDVNKGLVVLPAHSDNLERAARNAEGYKTLLSGYLNIRDIFTHDKLILSLDTLKKVEEWLG